MVGMVWGCGSTFDIHWGHMSEVCRGRTKVGRGYWELSWARLERAFQLSENSVRAISGRLRERRVFSHFLQSPPKPYDTLVLSALKHTSRA